MSTELVHGVALALQISCQTVNHMSHDEARRSISAQIERVAHYLRGAKGLVGPDVRLAVLPEYFLTGYPLGESIPEWAAKACIAPDGAEYDALGKVADANGVYLSGNAYETDPHFPDLYFQTSFVISPAGDVVLRYRRLISMFAPTPHDVWDRYLDLYGLDAVFPVADTDIGRLACCASEEILYPEICRAHALRGAEVILHSTSEVSSPELTPKDIAKRSRAVENQAYVVSANSGGILDSPILKNSVDGMSKIIDYKGNVLAAAGVGESMCANAELNVDALRRYRRRPGMGNLLARQRLELFAATYGGDSVHPANTLLNADGDFEIPERSHFVSTQRAVIADLVKKGVI